MTKLIKIITSLKEFFSLYIFSFYMSFLTFQQFWHLNAAQKCTFNQWFITLFTEYLEYGCRWKQHHHKMFFPVWRPRKAMPACVWWAVEWPARALHSLNRNRYNTAGGKHSAQTLRPFVGGVLQPVVRFTKAQHWRWQTPRHCQPWSEVQPPPNGTLSTPCL